MVRVTPSTNLDEARDLLVDALRHLERARRGGVSGAAVDDLMSDHELAVIADSIRNLRATRCDLLGDLFAEPAWDMLLDLFSAQVENRAVVVKSLTIAAAVPSTTALRWIAVLADQGAVVRTPDPDDRRRIFVSLTDATFRSLREWLSTFRTVFAR